MTTELSIGKSLGPLTAHTLFDLSCWCKDYDRRNKYPCDSFKRFAIGLYQIHQGMGWSVTTGVNKYESYAASAVHFMIVMEKVGLILSVPTVYTIFMQDIPNRPFDSNQAKDLLFNISAAQQQLFYSFNKNKTQRNSRYSPKVLGKYLSKIIISLIGIIPTEDRIEAFYIATKIMTQELK